MTAAPAEIIDTPWTIFNEFRSRYEAFSDEAWQGENIPIFSVQNGYQCDFIRNRLLCDLPAVSGWDVTNLPDGGIPSSGCRWDRCEVDARPQGQAGPFNCQYGWRVDYSLGGGPNVNNDAHQWTDCHVVGVTETAWYFRGGQSMLHKLERCDVGGVYQTKHAIVHDDSNTMKIVNLSGGTLTDYAVVLGQNSGGNGVMTDGCLENCLGGLLKKTGTATTPVTYEIIRNRLHRGIHPDFPTDLPMTADPLIDFGPSYISLKVEQNQFEVTPDRNGNWTPHVIRIDAWPQIVTDPRARPREVPTGWVRIVGNVFTQPTPTPVPQILVSTNVGAVECWGNMLYVGGQSCGEIKVTRF